MQSRRQHNSVYVCIMINIKQKRHINKKWQFGQGGPGAVQRVPRSGKSLGGSVAVAATRVRIPASCQILYIKYKTRDGERDQKEF